MQVKTHWSKKKEDDCYVTPEKLGHSYQEHEKYGSQLFGARKFWITSIQRLKNMDHCYLEAKENGSDLFGTRIMNQKNWFTAILSTKNSFAAIWRKKK